MKIQFISAPIPSVSKEISRLGVFPPLNLLTLATAVKSTLSNWEVEIIDGQILSLDQILSKVGAEVVGITTDIVSYENALKIAEHAKQTNALVVFGGAHASTVYRQVLINRKYVDFVVIGDGEEAIINLLRQLSPSSIPNLAYRISNEVKKNIIDTVFFGKFPHTRRDLIDNYIYTSNFELKYPEMGKVGNTWTVRSQRGCYYKNFTGGCTFCKKAFSEWEIRHPADYWKEIEQSQEEIKAEYFWDVSDSFTSIKPWLQALVDVSRGKNIPMFNIFGRADDLDIECVKYLEQLNVQKILIGLESGNQLILDKANKGQTIEKVLSACKNLSEYKIKFIPAFLLGFPSETESTLNDTVKLAHKVCSEFDVDEISCSLYLPLPDSRAYDLFMSSKRMRNKYKDRDLFDPKELLSDWIQEFTQITLSQIKDALNLITDNHKVTSCYIPNLK